MSHITRMDRYRQVFTRERIRAMLADPSFRPPQTHRTYYILSDDGYEIGLAALAEHLIPDNGRLRHNGYNVARILLEKGFQLHLKSATGWHDWMAAYEAKGQVVRDV